MANRFWARLRGMGSEWSAKGGSLLAAALAFYVALAFFPLLIVAISALGYMLRFSAAAQSSQAELIDLIAQRTSHELAGQVEQILYQVRLGAGFGGQVGLAILMLNVIGIFYHLQLAFDRIWEVKGSPPARGDLVQSLAWLALYRLRDFFVWCGLALLLLLAFVSGVAVAAFEAFMDALPVSPKGVRAVSFLTGVGVNTLIFALVYKVQPRVTLRWRTVWPGALLASGVWEIGRQLLAFVVTGAKYSAYGLVGSFIALMIWLYYGSMVLFLGAIYVRATYREQGTVDKNA